MFKHEKGELTFNASGGQPSANRVLETTIQKKKKKQKNHVESKRLEPLKRCIWRACKWKRKKH